MEFDLSLISAWAFQGRCSGRFIPVKNPLIPRGSQLGIPEQTIHPGGNMFGWAKILRRITWLNDPNRICLSFNAIHLDLQGTEAFSHWQFPPPELMGSWLRAVPIYDGGYE